MVTLFINVYVSFDLNELFRKLAMGIATRFCEHDNTCQSGLYQQWASYQIRKIAGCACAGNARTFSPAADFKGKRYLAIPSWITARASRTCRDACRDCLAAAVGKTFPAFPAHAHPQFYVSGKRPMPTVTEFLSCFRVIYVCMQASVK